MVSTQLTAWAALLAAVTSIATLLTTTIVSGRRQQRTWVREALTDAFVAYLDASWRSSDALRRRLDLGPGDPAEAQLEAARAAYEEMRTQLTRLRLLASPSVADAGYRLLQSQRLAIDQPGGADRAPLHAVSAGRQALIQRAKAEMGLRHTSLARLDVADSAAPAART
jgi:hypothetical protein